jgi:hypothetical protein
MSKRTQTLGLHHWTQNDLIVNFFYTKFGTRSLYIKKEEDLAKLIGTTATSFKKQSMNFRFLMGFNTRVLTDYSQLQKSVFESFNELPYHKFYQIVKQIIGQDEHERKQILILRGYNPDKLVRVK